MGWGCLQPDARPRKLYGDPQPEKLRAITKREKYPSGQRRGVCGRVEARVP